MLVIDTGVLLAAADDADPDHQACASLVESASGPLVTTALVVAETGYLVARQLGPDAEATFFRSIADGDVMIEDLTTADLARIADLVGIYVDLPLGGTDASLMAIAERLDQRTVATLDRRHFNVVRPTHCAAFELVP